MPLMLLALLSSTLQESIYSTSTSKPVIPTSFKCFVTHLTNAVGTTMNVLRKQENMVTRKIKWEYHSTTCLCSFHTNMIYIIFKYFQNAQLHGSHCLFSIPRQHCLLALGKEDKLITCLVFWVCLSKTSSQLCSGPKFKQKLNSCKRAQPHFSALKLGSAPRCLNSFCQPRGESCTMQSKHPRQQQKSVRHDSLRCEVR